MMNLTDKFVESKLSYSNLIWSIINGSMFLFIGIYIISITLEKAPNYISFGFGAIFSSLGLTNLLSAFRIDKLLINEEKLIIKSVFGYKKRIVIIREIHSYCEITKRNKHSKWNDLAIFTNKFSYEISSAHYSNYEVIKHGLIKGKERNIVREKEWSSQNNRILAGSFIVFGIILIIEHLWIHGFSPINFRDFWLGLIVCSMSISFGVFLLKKS